MRNCYTIDIEGALVEALRSDGFSASAPPVTAGLSAGDVVVYRVGGSRMNYVQDAHQLSIDCYHDTAEAAMALACELTGWLGYLHEVGGVPVYRVELTTLPYDNQDPANRDYRRATFAARIVTRVKHKEEA